MKSVYEQSLAAAAEAVFLLPGTEYVTYYPAGGGARRIRAMIQRFSEDSNIDGFAGGSRPSPTLLVRNDATAGISSAEVDTGGDEIEIALREGDKPVRARIVELVNHDPAWCRLRVQ